MVMFTKVEATVLSLALQITVNNELIVNSDEGTAELEEETDKLRTWFLQRYNDIPDRAEFAKKVDKLVREA